MIDYVSGSFILSVLPARTVIFYLGSKGPLTKIGDKFQNYDLLQPKLLLKKGEWLYLNFNVVCSSVG